MCISVSASYSEKYIRLAHGCFNLHVISRLRVYMCVPVYVCVHVCTGVCVCVCMGVSLARDMNVSSSYCLILFTSDGTGMSSCFNKYMSQN